MSKVEIAISKLKKHLSGVYEKLEKVDEDCLIAIQKATQLKKGILMGTIPKEKQIKMIDEVIEVLNGERV